ncbi:g11433 [Coccomyxa viridis]|uniref:G11433 protein n=1 Tax=Coccomyxa viridis TaxID=1274662 RepID=A0ABP1GCN4_9CHLO
MSPAQSAWVGTCVQFPANECGQAYGPCSAAQIGTATTYGGPSELYQECPDSTGCPSGYYCEGLTGAIKVGYPWAACLAIEPFCRYTQQ